METGKPICFEFKIMSHFVIRNLRKRLTEAGFDEVSVMHGNILGYLRYNSERAVYAKDIARAFEIGKSSVTNILQLMEEKGYITFLPDEKDGRLKRVLLTEKGITTHARTVEVIDNLHRELESGITPEEREIFFRVTNKIKENATRLIKEDETC